MGILHEETGGTGLIGGTGGTGGTGLVGWHEETGHRSILDGTAHRNAWLSPDGAILHIHIPMKLRKRGGRKVIVTADGNSWDGAKGLECAMPDDPVVQALVKARRWQKMLESGDVATIKELAAQEGVDRSYMARLLKLNVLAPDIVEQILAGDYSDAINLETLRKGIPLEWDEQREKFLVVGG